MGRKRRKREKKNKEKKLEVMGEAADAYSAYRPQVQEAHQKAFQNQMRAYGGVNNMLGMMYGDAAMVDTSEMGAPVDADMMGVGRSVSAPGLAPPTAADADFGHATGGEVWDPQPEPSGGGFTLTTDGETYTRSGEGGGGGVGSTSQGLGKRETPRKRKRPLRRGR